MTTRSQNRKHVPRRDFLKGAGAMAAGAAALGRAAVFAQEGSAGANERLGVGFIGTGGRAAPT